MPLITSTIERRRLELTTTAGRIDETRAVLDEYAQGCIKAISAFGDLRVLLGQPNASDVAPPEAFPSWEQMGSGSTPHVWDDDQRAATEGLNAEQGRLMMPYARLAVRLGPEHEAVKALYGFLGSYSAIRRGLGLAEEHGVTPVWPVVDAYANRLFAWRDAFLRAGSGLIGISSS